MDSRFTNTALDLCLIVPLADSVQRVISLPSRDGHLALGHQAGCHVLGSRALSRHCWSGHQPGQHGWRCTHAWLLCRCRGQGEWMAGRKRKACCFLQVMDIREPKITALSSRIFSRVDDKDRCWLLHIWKLNIFWIFASKLVSGRTLKGLLALSFFCCVVNGHSSETVKTHVLKSFALWLPCSGCSLCHVVEYHPEAKGYFESTVGFLCRSSSQLKRPRKNWLLGPCPSVLD